MARFELATPCLQGRCNNHYATSAQYHIIELYYNYKKNYTIGVPEVGFEPPLLSIIRLMTDALDHSATGTHYILYLCVCERNVGIEPTTLGS